MEAKTARTGVLKACMRTTGHVAGRSRNTSRVPSGKRGALKLQKKDKIYACPRAGERKQVQTSVTDWMEANGGLPFMTETPCFASSPRFARHVSVVGPSLGHVSARRTSDDIDIALTSAFMVATVPKVDPIVIPAPALARLSNRSTNTRTAAHMDAQIHRDHRRHHSTASVRTNSRGPLCTCRIVCGLETDAMAGYPKKGFPGDMGGREIVDGMRWRADLGGEGGREVSTPTIWGASGDPLGRSGRGGGGGRWCVW
jgi:hypothetical protein